ncbi:MAG: Hpt domain-containing protein [Nitrospira sp.]|nr:Hpt domain-containing protein [Nitrospira sp.]MCP9462656.1 Hpt domain-containing protein [Nitrospira sp.]MCP9475752.1 Hpt domain-containing protein [Nitrospira sp.]
MSGARIVSGVGEPMGSEMERRNLIGAFVEEASDALRILTETLHPHDGSEPAPQAIRAGVVAAHRIKQAAALYGYDGVARLGERLEALCEKTATVSDHARCQGVLVTRKLVQGMETLVQAILKGEEEDRTVIEEWLASSAAFLNDRSNSSAAEMPVRSSIRADPTKDTVTGGRSHEGAPPVICETDTDPNGSDRYFLPTLDEEEAWYFSLEVEEHLRGLEDGLLRLNEGSDDRELIDRLFRTAHTLKGSAYTVGFQAIGDLVHRLEDFLEAVRAGSRSATSEQVRVLLHAVDVIRALSRRNPMELEETRRRFHAVASELQCVDQDFALDRVLKRDFTETPSSLKRAEDPVHDRAKTERRNDVGKKEKPKIILIDSSRFDRLMNLVDDLMIGWGRLDRQLRSLERLAEQTSRGKAQRGESFESGASGHEHEGKDNPDRLARRSGPMNDAMIDIATQLREGLQHAREEMDEARRATGSLREAIAGVGLVPVGLALSRFQRVVREISNEVEKRASLILGGAHVEVDASILERLADALTHLIRNAVFHGIESPSERAAQGKPEVGTISVRVERRGRALVITIKDDGRGVDMEAVRQKALMMELIRPESLPSLSEQEILQCIFAPGFSTASKASPIAGRGVGLDAVKRIMEEIGGRVEVKSHPNVGTTFVLHLPVTPLITTVLLVRSEADRYAIPLSNVRAVTVSPTDSLIRAEERTLLRWDEGTVEVRSLLQILKDESEPREASMPIVVVQTARGTLGLTVDEVLERRDLTIRTWDSLKLLDRSYFSGTAVDQDGRLVLVIDPNRLQIGQPGSAIKPDSSAAGNSSQGEACENACKN